MSANKTNLSRNLVEHNWKQKLNNLFTVEVKAAVTQAMLAAERGDLKIVQLFFNRVLEKGMNVELLLEHTNGLGYTIFLSAALSGKLEIMQYMMEVAIKAGIAPELLLKQKTNSSNFFPHLFCCSVALSLEKIKNMLEFSKQYGMDFKSLFELKNDYRATIVHFAAHNSSAEVFKGVMALAIEAGIDPKKLLEQSLWRGQRLSHMAVASESADKFAYMIGPVHPSGLAVTADSREKLECIVALAQQSGIDLKM
ncbi:MAG: hypothetical protein NTW08_05280 [Gammaproteobacteria bacterium]|nr:hypothetical protein [Gammaproteobacteria bacterium]